MSETLKIRCQDCEKDGNLKVWFAIYLAYFQMPLGETKMIEVIDQSKPITTADLGGSTILNHHNTNFLLNEKARHSHFIVSTIEGDQITDVGSLICSTSTQIFTRTKL